MDVKVQPGGVHAGDLSQKDLSSVPPDKSGSGLARLAALILFQEPGLRIRPAPADPEAKDLRIEPQADDQIADQQVRSAGEDGFRLWHAHGRYFPAERLSDETVLGYFAPFASADKAEAVQGYVAGLDSSVTVAIRDDLARFRHATLVVWGTADQFFPVSWARWLAATIPGTVRCVEVEGAKLLFPAEHPEALNRELRDLWAAVDPGNHG